MKRNCEPNTTPSAIQRTAYSLILLALAVTISTASPRLAPQSQPILQITSPSVGAIVNPGQSLLVSVNSNSPSAFQGFALIGDDPIGFVGTIPSLPGQITVLIPTSKIDCGTHVLTVESTPTGGSGPVFASVAIDVERPDFPTQLSTTVSGLALESMGEQINLDLLAYFSDGALFTVTASSYVAYSSSNTAVATVDSSGNVTAVGAGNASIVVTYTLSGQSLQISIPVNVSAPKLAVSPASLTFPSQAVGTSSAPQQLTLTNVSPDNLGVLALTVGGDFSEVDNCVASSPLGLSASCTANVTFAPTATGLRTGSLSIAHSASLIPIAIQLSGTGIAGSPSIASLSPNSGAVGTSVTITGSNFGSAQGSSTLTFNGTSATPANWSDTSIVVPVPAGASTGNVVLTVGGVASNGLNFTVQGTTNGIILVQHTSIDIASAASGSLSFPSNNAAGNWIGVCVRAGRSNEAFTVTDSRGNTYRQAVQFNDTLDAPNGNTIAIFYAENIASGVNTITVSDTISATLRFAILEYTGVATANSLDVTAAAQDNSTSPNSGSAATAASGELLLGAIATADAANYSTPSGVEIREFVPAEPNTKLIAEYQIQTAAGSATASASLAASDPWGAILACFKRARP